MAILRRLRFTPIHAVTPATSAGTTYAMALQCCRHCGAPNVISQFLPGTHPVTVEWYCTGCLMTWTEIANPGHVRPDIMPPSTRATSGRNDNRWLRKDAA